MLAEMKYINTSHSFPVVASRSRLSTLSTPIDQATGSTDRQLARSNQHATLVTIDIDSYPSRHAYGARTSADFSREQAEKGESTEGTFEVTFSWDDEAVSFAEWLEHYGKIPLPPYIKRAAEDSDEERYQTVYAKHDGSVAAPTAGLHFTPAVFDSLHAKGIATEYITLHVGAGTFLPVKSRTIGEHAMHTEPFSVSRTLLEILISNAGNPVISVGTTSTRCLE